jgi:hypothetical protein
MSTTQRSESSRLAPTFSPHMEFFQPIILSQLIFAYKFTVFHLKLFNCEHVMKTMVKVQLVVQLVFGSTSAIALPIVLSSSVIIVEGVCPNIAFSHVFHNHV